MRASAATVMRAVKRRRRKQTVTQMVMRGARFRGSTMARQIDAYNDLLRASRLNLPIVTVVS